MLHGGHRAREGAAHGRWSVLGCLSGHRSRREKWSVVPTWWFAQSSCGTSRARLCFTSQSSKQKQNHYHNPHNHHKTTNNTQHTTHNTQQHATRNTTHNNTQHTRHKTQDTTHNKRQPNNQRTKEPKNQRTQQTQQQASDSSVPTLFCCVTFVARWTLAGSPSQELPSDVEGADCVLLGGMSSSRSPRPLPRTPTTQLHGDRRWQGPGRWVRDEVHGQVPEHPTPQAAGAQHFAMDAGEDVGEAPAAGRPAPLLEVLPQERVQQHTAEQIVDPVPLVPLLHDVVPQMVKQLVDFLTPLDFPVPEQVVAVPKISGLSRPSRASLREPQMAEHLMEVPTIVSYSFLQQLSVEQPVDTPVPHGGFSHRTGFNSAERSHSSPSS